MNRQTILAYRGNYGAKRKESDIKGLVLHYTSNDGDTDEGNAHYFQRPLEKKSSAHYFVDDDSATQSVPNDYIAWHCGTKGKYYHPFLRNANTIGIEMCDTTKDGVHDLSTATRQNVIELARELISKYNIPYENVVRHYDITHKNCPAYFVADEQAWKQFKDEIFQVSNMNTSTAPQPSQTIPKQPQAIVRNYLVKGDRGEAVKTMQQMLNNCGYNCGIADGIFGNNTRIQLIAFQKANGLSSDGIYGNASKSKLEEVNARPKIVFNQHVHDLQWAINTDGIAKLSEDGLYGSDTNNAIKHCVVKKGSKGNVVAWVQCRIGASVDGGCGANTVNKIKEYQRQHGLTDDGCAGYNTIKTILRQYDVNC